MGLIKMKSLRGKELVVHLALYLIGVLIMPLGVVFTINAHIGAGGYDAFNFALGEKLGIPTSAAIYLTAFIAVLIAAVIRGGIPNILTFVSSFFIGLATDFWKGVLVNVQAEGYVMGFLFTVIGRVVVAFAVAAYVISYFPTNPTDDLMVALSEKNIRLGTAKIGMDLVCVVLAFILGGEIGLGTILVTFGLGPVVDLFHGIWKKGLEVLGISVDS